MSRVTHLACGLLLCLGTVVRAHVLLEATLDTAQEVPPAVGTLPGAGGSGFFAVNEAMIDYTVSVENLTGPPTAAHIHEGSPGVAGPVVLALDHTAVTGTSGVMRGRIGPLTPDQQQALFDHGFYVNVHTAANGDGEVRGQITAVEGSCSCVDLSRKLFKRCVKARIEGTPGEPADQIELLQKAVKVSSCGRKRAGRRKAVACCLPSNPIAAIVRGKLCAPVSAKRCRKMGGQPGGKSCFPANPCVPPAS